MFFLTYDTIEQIAKKFIKIIGGYTQNEEAIPEKDIEDFVREIEREIHNLNKDA